MIRVEEFRDGINELSVLKNGMDKICVVHSFMGYIFIARYRKLPQDKFYIDYCHHYQLTFDKRCVMYSIGSYPESTVCKEVDRDEFMEYLETNWPEDVEWLLFHPELYSGKFNPDV